MDGGGRDKSEVKDSVFLICLKVIIDLRNWQVFHSQEHRTERYRVFKAVGYPLKNVAHTVSEPFGMGQEARGRTIPAKMSKNNSITHSV